MCRLEIIPYEDQRAVCRWSDKYTICKPKKNLQTGKKKLYAD